MSTESTILLLQLALPLVALIITYGIGSFLERRHLRLIRKREETYRSYPVVTFSELPADWQPTAADAVEGSVVISLDYFKRFVAGLRALVGGRVKSYEPLLDRGRREAVLRMIEQAQARGFDGVVNVRLETSRLAGGERRGNKGEGTAGIEMLAYGTGLVLAKPSA